MFGNNSFGDPTAGGHATVRASTPLLSLALSLPPISLSVTFCKANVDHLREAWHVPPHTLRESETERESEIRAFRLFA